MYIPGPAFFKKLNLFLICLNIVVLTYYTSISSGIKNKKIVTGETTPTAVECQHGIQTKQNDTSDPESSPTRAAARTAMQMGPPSFISENHRKLIETLGNAIKIANNTSADDSARLFAVLSDVVQAQLFNLQQQTNCSRTNFVCGHIDACGFGCQNRHRMVCLMVSYALGIPLIHDEQTSWPYTDSWSSVFLPMGSKCKIGQQTYRLQWTGPFPPLNATHPQEHHPDQIEFPLKNGLQVSKEIADLVELIHPNPYHWWLGQFLKFGMQLRPHVKSKIEVAKRAIKFKKPVVGLHIRRTDKKWGSKLYAIEDYMKIAEEYFRNSGNAGIKSVFVASEDATVLNATREVYSAEQWNVIGFTNRTTLPDQSSRRDALVEILIDLFLLAECDFVVCAFSSNICSMVSDMQHYIYRDSVKRLKSLDGSYIYHFLHHEVTSIPEKIVKII